MALEPFATEQQMNDRTLGAITTSSHPFLSAELKAASKLIRNECRWHIAKEETLTLRRVLPFAEAVWLPAMKISELTSAKIDGTLVDPAAIEFDEQTGWTNLCGRRIEVVFRAGFTEVPDDLVTLTLQIAARALGAPLGVVREQSLTSSVTWSATAPGVAGGDVLMQHELDQLAEYRIGRLP